MLHIKTAACAAVALGAATASAHAEDAGRWFVHLGPAYVDPAETASITMGGQPVAGGDVAIDGRWSVEGEVGYFVTRNIAVTLAGGYPPTFKIDAAGTLAGLGTTGKLVGGPAAITVQYRLNRGGRIQPYVSTGAAFLIVFDTKDGLMSELKAKSDVGPMVGGGFDVMVNDRWGLFFDAKKAWVGTVATGFLGPNPVRAEVTVNPFVYNAGLSYHF